MVDYCGKGCLFFYNLIYLVRINFLFEFLLFLSFSGEKDIFKNMGYKREWMWGTHFFEAWNYNWKEKHESFTLTVSTMFCVLVKRNLIFNLAFVIEKLGTVLFYPEIYKRDFAVQSEFGHCSCNTKEKFWKHLEYRFKT